MENEYLDHLIASAYPEATIFSIGPYDETADRFIQESDRLHVKKCMENDLWN